MFEPTSRYFLLETATFTSRDGRDVVYKRRRFLPLVKEGVVLAEHTVTQGERLDNITARYLGDPELFWQLCDINNAMHPEDLTAEIGRKLRVSLPQI
jgi:hypothetical protein